MPMNWTPENDAKLMAAILATTQCKVDNAAVAAYMGSDCTAKAVSHRVGALKKKALEGGAGTNPSTPAKLVTPNKRGTKKDTKNDSSDGDVEESPAKKPKTTKAAVTTPRAKGKKKEATLPTTPATPGDLEDGGVKLETSSDDES